MKVAAYTIALNEEKFVESWYESAKEADYLLIADTGSTDETVSKARQLGIHVVELSVKPWRFDVARNASLAVIPADIDYCIALDMDEVILPGWREHLEVAHKNEWTRPRYTYTWNWTEDGKPGLQYQGDKIHARFGYRWKHPVHEVCGTYGGFVETQGAVGLEIHHHADNTKPRSQYLPLLKMSVEEDPNDDRNAYYYGRDLFFYGHFEEAAKELKRHLSLPTARWPAERAASMRYIARSVPEEAEYWFKKAVEEAPGRREPLVDLAALYYERSNWENSLGYSLEALAIKEKPLDYLCEAVAWGSAPHDYAAIACYRLGRFEEAVGHAKAAVNISPNDERLIQNLKFCEEALEQ